MTISDRDAWSAAALLIKRFGEAARWQADQRADALVAEGDTEGAAMWSRIVDAIVELQRPREGEAVN